MASEGRPPNYAAISALRKADIRTLGHKDAAEVLLNRYGIRISWQSIGRIRRTKGIPWANIKVATKYASNIRSMGKEPQYSELIEKLHISHEHAIRLIKS